VSPFASLSNTGLPFSAVPRSFPLCLFDRANRSTILVENLSPVVKKGLIFSGKSGVKYQMVPGSRISSVVLPFTVAIFNKANYFSLLFGGRNRTFY